MAVVAQSPDVVTPTRGTVLTDEAWLAARIAELNAAWRIDSMRVGATLWWCMTASALVEPVVRALVRGTPVAPPSPHRLALSLRPDGTVETVRIRDVDNAAVGRGGAGDGQQPGAHSSVEHPSDNDRAPQCGPAAPREAAAEPVATALRTTLDTVIERITTVSGVPAPALWAVVTDVVASWAVDARAPEVGTRLAAELGPALPAPRFVDIDDRTFVRRASCCLIYAAPGCEKCVSCPKRPPAERAALLADYARRR